jgi:hypothetical protein
VGNRRVSILPMANAYFYLVKCILSYPSSSDEFTLETFIVFISVPPKFLLDKNFKDTITLHAGKSQIVEIPFEGSPMPEVFWTFNDGAFTDETRIKADTVPSMTALSLGKVQRPDAGEYHLTIKNNFGTTDVIVTLIVLGKLATHLASAAYG